MLNINSHQCQPSLSFSLVCNRHYHNYCFHCYYTKFFPHMHLVIEFRALLWDLPSLCGRALEKPTRWPWKAQEDFGSLIILNLAARTLTCSQGKHTHGIVDRSPALIWPSFTTHETSLNCYRLSCAVARPSLDLSRPLSVWIRSRTRSQDTFGTPKSKMAQKLKATGRGTATTQALHSQISSGTKLSTMRAKLCTVRNRGKVCVCLLVFVFVWLDICFTCELLNGASCSLDMSEILNFRKMTFIMWSLDCKASLPLSFGLGFFFALSSWLKPFTAVLAAVKESLAQSWWERNSPFLWAQASLFMPI